MCFEGRMTDSMQLEKRLHQVVPVKCVLHGPGKILYCFADVRVLESQHYW